MRDHATDDQEMTMPKNDAPDTESTRDVLIDALTKVSEHEPPTSREVLQIVIRLECARAGLPKPDFDCYPAGDVLNQVLFPDRD